MIIVIILNPHMRIWSLILERKGGRAGERETSVSEGDIDRLPLIDSPTGGRTCNPGMCPDWGSNLQPFGTWDETQNN